MPSDLVLIGTSLVTVFASGVVSSVVTYRLNRSKERFAFMRQKAEQLYLTVNEFGTNFDVVAYTQMTVARGEITWDEMNDMANGSLDKQPKHGGAETMLMLIDIYFPEVRPSYLKMDAARDQFMGVKGAHKQLYLRGEGVGTAIFETLNKAADAFDAAKQVLIGDIVAASRSYAVDGVLPKSRWWQRKKGGPLPSHPRHRS